MERASHPRRSQDLQCRTGRHAGTESLSARAHPDDAHAKVRTSARVNLAEAMGWEMHCSQTSRPSLSPLQLLKRRIARDHNFHRCCPAELDGKI